jgi:3-oxosteroid 1-dehydrogenase
MNTAVEIRRQYDVLVVGSGAGGMLAAIRAHELGCSVVLIEKASQYGGTTAASAGGTWIPLNDAVAAKDSKELAMTYLRAVVGPAARESMLQAYVDCGPTVMRYLEALGIPYVGGSPFPDYFSQLPGAIRGRSMLPLDQDGKALGLHFDAMRESHPATRLLDRYSLNSKFAAALAGRTPGWKKVLARIVWDYWSDIPWRLKTRKDRRLTMGRAVIGGLRKAMADRGIPLCLNTPLTGLVSEGGRVSAARVQLNDTGRQIAVAKGVILASGGFEHSQSLRDKYLLVPTRTDYSASPRDGVNTGDALQFALELGATVEHMGNAWWCPCMVTPPSRHNPRAISYPIFFDRAKPGSLSVNRLGERFVNESVSYDLFGLAMAKDQLATQANAPCWMIFDARFRAKYAAGAVLPSWAMSDTAVPKEWWDKVIYRAEDIESLARKILVPPPTLKQSISRFNTDAVAGVDQQFARGTTDAQRAIGDASVKPNPSLAPLTQSPFYAVKVDLGDLGTRGGLMIDEVGAVLGRGGARIPALYATGDVTATIFGDTYPGGGAAIGPAVVFGYLAANDVAQR